MLKAGEPAPDFRLPLTTGRPLTLGSCLEKGPALLAFYKVSCPVCQYTFPFLERLASGVTVVGICQDDADAAREFSQSFGVSFPSVVDSVMAGYPVSNAFGIMNVPSLFLVEPDRRIALSGTGFSRADMDTLAARFSTEVIRSGEKVPDFRPG